MMKEQAALEYQRNHEAMKAWNERRAKAESDGVKKFYALKAMFREWSEKYNSQSQKQDHGKH